MSKKGSTYNVLVKNIYLNPQSYPKAKIYINETQKEEIVTLKKEHIDFNNPTKFGIKLVESLKSKTPIKIILKPKEHNGHANTWMNPFFESSELDVDKFLEKNKA